MKASAFVPASGDLAEGFESTDGSVSDLCRSPCRQARLPGDVRRESGLQPTRSRAAAQAHRRAGGLCLSDLLDLTQSGLRSLFFRTAAAC
jgi:hypothetical protein